MNLLINAAIRPATRTSYIKTWHNFIDFLAIFNYSNTLPIDEYKIALYITHLYRLKLKPGTIKTYISAIAYFHKINRHEDPTKSYFVKQVIKGTSRRSKGNSYKLKPFTMAMLRQIQSIIGILYNTRHDQCLFKALLSLAYFACLRAGEAVISNSRSHTLHVNNVTLDNNKITLQFRSYKHCSFSNTKYILNPTPRDDICPVKHLANYLAISQTSTGPLFKFCDGTPVTRAQYSDFIKTAVHFIGLDPSQYNTHSVRIGRATDLALAGTSHETIKRTGRWHSSAYLNYIRLENFVLPTN